MKKRQAKKIALLIFPATPETKGNKLNWKKKTLRNAIKRWIKYIGK